MYFDDAQKNNCINNYEVKGKRNIYHTIEMVYRLHPDQIFPTPRPQTVTTAITFYFLLPVFKNCLYLSLCRKNIVL